MMESLRSAAAGSRVLSGALSFGTIAAAWELGVRAGLLNPFFTPAPSDVARALGRQIVSGELPGHLAVSLSEFGVGFGSAVLAGVLLGTLAGWFRTVEYVVDPFLWFVYSAPLIAFYPLFVIWFGLGAGTVIAITFLLAVTPIAVNTMTGVMSVAPEITRAARSFGATRRDLFWKVALPASVPMMTAGLRLGVGRALTGVVIAELFGATAGLGYAIGYYGALLDTTNMLAALSVVVLLGVLFTQALSALEARFDSWRTGPGA